MDEGAIRPGQIEAVNAIELVDIHGEFLCAVRMGRRSKNERDIP